MMTMNEYLKNEKVRISSVSGSGIVLAGKTNLPGGTGGIILPGNTSGIVLPGNAGKDVGIVIPDATTDIDKIAAECGWKFR